MRPSYHTLMPASYNYFCPIYCLPPAVPSASKHEGHKCLSEVLSCDTVQQEVYGEVGVEYEHGSLLPRVEGESVRVLWEEAEYLIGVQG